MNIGLWYSHCRASFVYEVKLVISDYPVLCCKEDSALNNPSPAILVSHGREVTQGRLDGYRASNGLNICFHSLDIVSIESTSYLLCRRE